MIGACGYDEDLALAGCTPFVLRLETEPGLGGRREGAGRHGASEIVFIHILSRRARIKLHCIGIHMQSKNTFLGDLSGHRSLSEAKVWYSWIRITML
jgi:hypothetical protein